MRRMTLNSCANRGRTLELMVEWQNHQYRAQGLAVVHKVPTAFIPLRSRGDDGQSRIAGAKVEQKAAVDFLGVYRGRALAFDAKQTSERRIRWDRVEPHQAEFLTDWERRGGLSFVLVGFFGDQPGRYFLVPWRWWRERLEDYDRRIAERREPASVSWGELAKEWQIAWTWRATLDYLAVVDRLLAGEGVA